MMSVVLASNAFWGHNPNAALVRVQPEPPVSRESMKFMINRKNEIKLRLSDDELYNLNRCVQQTGMSREQYLRTIINCLRPVQTPPLDYFNLIREIRRVGYNMRQIAQRAYTLNLVDAPYYQQNARRVLDMCDDLTMICLPRKAEPQP